MDAIQKETLLSLSNSVKLLLEKIDSKLVDNIKMMNLDVSLLEKVQQTLVDLEGVLYHASNKLIPCQANNKSLNFLRRLVFEVAYLLDESHFLRYPAITAKLLEIHSRLPFLIEVIKSNSQHLIQILEGLSSGEQLGEDESSIYGRDADIQKLIHLLFSSKIRVISIVGMGGIGKTALAKHLFNLPLVKAKFQLKRWADFSEGVDDVSLYESILRSITSKTTINGVYPIFLLVLDGVWDERSVNWTSLMNILNAGETQSRIIVTTRDERVAISMKTFLSLHYLRPLEVQDCWSLLVEHAFGGHGYHRLSYLDDIVTFRKEMREKIAKKCDGLPLAAVEHGIVVLLFRIPEIKVLY